VVVVAAVAWIGWTWGPAAYHHAEYLHLQKECMEWDPPEGTVVFEHDPIKAAALLTTPNYDPIPGNVSRNLHQLGFPPVQLAMHKRPEAAQILPTTLIRAGNYILFMHRRRTPAGRDRLVLLPLRVGEGSADGYSLGVRKPFVFDPAPFWPQRPIQALGDAANATGWGSGQTYEIFGHWNRDPTSAPVAPRSHIRFYAGHPDPADASHFTMRYDYLTNVFDDDGREIGEVWKSNVLHGWLRDDDTVELKQEHGGGHFENLPTLR
jgi:hypothetical protein